MARDLHEAVEQLPPFAAEAWRRLLRHLGEEALRDLPDRPATHGRDPGDGQEILDERTSVLVVGPGQRGQQTRMVLLHARRTVQYRIDRPALFKAAFETPLPEGRQFDRAKKLSDKARVAHGDLQARRTDRRAGPERKLQDLGIRRRDVGSAEAFETRLDELAAGARPRAKHRATIAIACRASGPWRLQVSPAGRDRIFGPQAKFRPRGVARQVEARTNIFAAEVEKGRCILQDRRLDAGIASLDQPAQDNCLHVLWRGDCALNGRAPNCNIHVHACGSICNWRGLAKARRGGDLLWLQR